MHKHLYDKCLIKHINENTWIQKIKTKAME